MILFYIHNPTLLTTVNPTVLTINKKQMSSLLKQES